jgi:hypothetical protein
MNVIIIIKATQGLKKLNIHSHFIVVIAAEFRIFNLNGGTKKMDISNVFC